MLNLPTISKTKKTESAGHDQTGAQVGQLVPTRIHQGHTHIQHIPLPWRRGLTTK
jgi:hypothetical protein